MAFGIYSHNKEPNSTESVHSTMARITLPPDLAARFAACEHAYGQATQQGYGEHPNVIAAVTELRSAWKGLHIANCDLVMAKGLFAVEFASMRFERACRVTREACSKLQMATAHAAAEKALYDRCLILANPDEDSEKPRNGARIRQAS